MVIIPGVIGYIWAGRLVFSVCLGIYLKRLHSGTQAYCRPIYFTKASGMIIISIT